MGLLWENPRGNAALAKSPPQGRREAGAHGDELAAEARAAMGRVHNLPNPAGRPLSGVAGPAAVTRSFRTGCSCHRAGFA